MPDVRARDWGDTANSPIYAASGHAAIVNNTAFSQCRAIYVGVGGDITLTMGGTDVLYKNAVSGSILPVQATQVKSTNTTATNLIALY